MSDGYGTNREYQEPGCLDRLATKLAPLALPLSIGAILFSIASATAELVGEATRQSIASCVAENKPANDCIKKAGIWGEQDSDE